MHRTWVVVGLAALAGCGSSGGGDGVDGGPVVTSCKLSVSGPVSVTDARCLVSATHDNATNKTLFQVAPLGSVPNLKEASFAAVLGSTDLQARTYDVHSVSSLFSDVQTSDATLYFASLADPVLAYPDQGSFTLVVSATGDVLLAGTDGKSWAPHGTLDAVMPADREGPGQGNATFHAVF